MKNLMPIAQSTDAPILKLEWPTQYDHLLRPADRNNVDSVVSYLWGKNLEVYLGGGVVEKFLFGTFSNPNKSRFKKFLFRTFSNPNKSRFKYSYNDIDILATGLERQILDVKIGLEKSEEADDWDNPPIEPMFISLKKEAKGTPFDYDNVRFEVKSKEAEGTPFGYDNAWFEVESKKAGGIPFGYDNIRFKLKNEKLWMSYFKNEGPLMRYFNTINPARFLISVKEPKRKMKRASTIDLNLKSF